MLRGLCNIAPNPNNFHARISASSSPCFARRLSLNATWKHSRNLPFNMGESKSSSGNWSNCARFWLPVSAHVDRQNHENALKQRNSCILSASFTQQILLGSGGNTIHWQCAREPMSAQPTRQMFPIMNPPEGWTTLPAPLRLRKCLPRRCRRASGGIGPLLHKRNLWPGTEP